MQGMNRNWTTTDLLQLLGPRRNRLTFIRFLHQYISKKTDSTFDRLHVRLQTRIRDVDRVLLRLVDRRVSLLDHLLSTLLDQFQQRFACLLLRC